MPKLQKITDTIAQNTNRYLVDNVVKIIENNSDIIQQGTKNVAEIHNNIQKNNDYSCDSIMITENNKNIYEIDLEGYVEFGEEFNLKLEMFVNQSNTFSECIIRMSNAQGTQTIEYPIKIYKDDTLQNLTVGFLKRKRYVRFECRELNNVRVALVRTQSQQITSKTEFGIIKIGEGLNVVDGVANANDKVNLAGDILQGQLIGAPVSVPFVLRNASASASYLLWETTVNNVVSSWGYFGKGGSGNDFKWNSYVHGTSLTLQSDRITADKDIYVGTTKVTTDVIGGYQTNYGTEIPTGANMYQILAPGRYYCPTNVVAGTLTGVPPFGGTVAFTMEVYSISPTNTDEQLMYKVQDCTDYNGNKEIRVRKQMTWAVWEKTAYKSYVDAQDATLLTNINTRALQSSLNTTNNNLTTTNNNLNTTNNNLTTLTTRVNVLTTYSSATATTSVSGFTSSSALKVGKSGYWSYDSGSANLGALATGGLIATIPVGYRPLATVYGFMTTGNSDSDTIQFQISANGQVTRLCSGSRETLYRGMFAFPVEGTI